MVEIVVDRTLEQSASVDVVVEVDDVDVDDVHVGGIADVGEAEDSAVDCFDRPTRQAATSHAEEKKIAEP